ncbi:MAG: hypothetical protein JWO20_1812 [Candidatus Angelobacter sp.]|jgi:hypothetical protein|nr:hypothetical protein [Candidatus Angelobacter sp.]
MVRFECDTCGKLKDNGEPWILGFAAESVGVKSARREINIASGWDDAQAVDWLAVHFCSDDCRAEYTERLFSNRTIPIAGETASVKKSTAVRTRRKRA